MQLKKLSMPRKSKWAALNTSSTIAMAASFITTLMPFPILLRTRLKLLALIRTGGWSTTLRRKRRGPNALWVLAPGLRRLAPKRGRRADGGDVGIREPASATKRRDRVRSHADRRTKPQRYQRCRCACAGR